MKYRLLALLVAIAMTVPMLGTHAYAQGPIIVMLDGGPLPFDVPPMVVEGRTMVPMRVIFEALGATVSWDDATRTITATRDGLVVRATVGDRVIHVNNQRVTMDVAPVIVNGRTLVPVRFVSEALDAEVDWYAAGNTVFITSPRGDSFVSAEEQ